ncbi:hypothetical protein F4782DRAFT_336417 [Xylaria castorea]|nr:hypothetical protein F4782DRAFT_336417 [Xylaria castorea]
MSLRRLWTRAPHTPRTATSQGWSTASRPTHPRVQIPYRDARLGSQKYGKQQHSSKAYSKYAPGGPSPYYGAYGQPPKSRATRLKDMAIGSALAVIVYLAYVFYNSRQVLQETMEAKVDEDYTDEAPTGGAPTDGGPTDEAWDVRCRYEKLLRKAEAEDDGSPESAEKIRRIFVERTIAVVHAEVPDKEKDTFTIEDMGPLPRFPKGHKKHGSEMVKDEDTVVLVQPPMSEEELAGLHPKDRARAMVRMVVVAVNDSVENFGIGNLDPRIHHPTHPKFYEIERRLDIMMDDLFEVGTLKPHPTIVVTLFLRDGIEPYLYSPRSLIRLARVSRFHCSEAGSDGGPHT